MKTFYGRQQIVKKNIDMSTTMRTFIKNAVERDELSGARSQMRLYTDSSPRYTLTASSQKLYIALC